MRILHVTGDCGLGGTETILRNIAAHTRSMPDVSHEFVLFPAGQLKDALESSGAITHVLDAVRLREPLRVVQARRQFKAIIHRQHYDAVIYHQYSWMPLILCDLVSGPVQVRWFHNTAADNWTERWLSKLHPDFPGLSIYCSESLRSQLHTHGPSAVLYAPIAAVSSSDEPAESAQVRAELKTPPDSTVIVHVGRMTEMKGQRVLLQALAHLRHRSDWTCWIVGGAQNTEQAGYFNDLQERAQTAQISDRVRFLGNRTDVARLLAAADIYCQPNLQPEAFGITFIEALYAGLPVVTTGFGGAAEIVDPTCGLLVPAPPTPAEVSRTLLRVLEDRSLLQSLSDSARPRARQLCDADTQTQRFKQLLLSVSERP